MKTSLKTLIIRTSHITGYLNALINIHSNMNDVEQAFDSGNVCSEKLRK